MSAPLEFDFESNGLAIAWLQNHAYDLERGWLDAVDPEDVRAVVRLLSIAAAEIGGRPEDYEINDRVDGQPLLIDQIRARIAAKVEHKDRRFAPASNVIVFPVHRTRPPKAA